MITGREGYWRFSSLSTSRPSRPGRAMSRSTRSGAVSRHQFQGGLPVRGGEHLKALVLEDARHHLEDLGFVVNYQQRCRHNRPVHGKFNNKFGAPGEVVFHPDMALVFRHDGIDDGQAQAGAAPLGGEVGLKDPHLVPVRDAAAGVGHGEFHSAVGRMSPQRDGDRPGPVDGGQGVVQQIEEQPLHLLPVQEQGRQLGVGVKLQGHPGLDFLVEEHGLLDQGVEVLGRQGQLGQPGEPGEVIHQVLEFIHLVDDDLGAFLEDLARPRPGARRSAAAAAGPPA